MTLDVGTATGHIARVDQLGAAVVHQLGSIELLGRVKRDGHVGDVRLDRHDRLVIRSNSVWRITLQVARRYRPFKTSISPKYEPRRYDL